MKSIKGLVLASILCLGVEQVMFARKEEDHNKNSQHEHHSQSNESHSSSRKNEHANNSHKSDSRRSESLKIPSHLIQDFVKAANQIPQQNNKPRKKGEKPQSKGSKKDRNNKINRAYEAYKKLFEASKKPHASISKSESKQVKRAVGKLFDAKNIKNMVWSPTVS